MIRFCRQALAGAISWLPLALLASAAVSLAAQAPTGKIEGRVRTQDGTPLRDAQLTILGTAFHGLTDPRGYYFLNNLPAGPVSLRAVFIGYRPFEVHDLRVLADQTVTQDFVLEAAPIALEEISVVTAYNQLVPRDEVTTRQRVDGAFVDRLPVDRLVEVMALQPGVVANAGGTDLSLRGGRPEETAVYVDGVPVWGSTWRPVRWKRPRSPPGRPRPSSATSSRGWSPFRPGRVGPGIPGPFRMRPMSPSVPTTASAGTGWRRVWAGRSRGA
jgi:hypothetical protein